jgi:hypothetical protein
MTKTKNMVIFSELPNPEGWDFDSFKFVSNKEAKRCAEAVNKEISRSREQGRRQGLEEAAKMSECVLPGCSCSGNRLAAKIRAKLEEEGKK